MFASLSLSLPLLGLLLQILTSHASPAALTSSPNSPQTTAFPDISAIMLQARDSSTSSSTVKSYSGNLLITFAPVATTISGTPTTLIASTPSGQAAVATPYPPPPSLPTSGLSIGAKAAIGAGAVVVCIFLGFALCCFAMQTRHKRANRRAAANGGIVKEGNPLIDMKPWGPAQGGPGGMGHDRKGPDMGLGPR